MILTQTRQSLYRTRPPSPAQLQTRLPVLPDPDRRRSALSQQQFVTSQGITPPKLFEENMHHSAPLPDGHHPNFPQGSLTIEAQAQNGQVQASNPGGQVIRNYVSANYCEIVDVVHALANEPPSDSTLPVVQSMVHSFPDVLQMQKAKWRSKRAGGSNLNTVLVPTGDPSSVATLAMPIVACLPPVAKRRRVQCEHGRAKPNCRTCSPQNFCQHDKKKGSCKECGDTPGRCQHDKSKYACRTCSPQNFCRHNKRKTHCRECGGSALCAHGRQKSQCKQCGGSSICEHGKEKRVCEACGGSALCKHRRRKTQCVECGGSSMCPHGRFKNKCKECKGSGVCDHGRRRTECPMCKGGSTCEHRRIRYDCKDCVGNRLCEHGQRKRKCKECGGCSALQTLAAVTKE